MKKLVILASILSTFTMAYFAFGEKENVVNVLCSDGSIVPHIVKKESRMADLKSLCSARGAKSLGYSEKASFDEKTKMLMPDQSKFARPGQKTASSRANLVASPQKSNASVNVKVPEMPRQLVNKRRR